jgi:hypothetical protein
LRAVAEAEIAIDDPANVVQVRRAAAAETLGLTNTPQLAARSDAKVPTDRCASGF